MQILKRVAVWLVETCAEALLIGLFLVLRFGHDPHEFFKDTFLYAVCVSLMFFSTGYLLSTIIVRALWKGKQWWPYSVIAAALAIAHYEIMDFSMGGAFEAKDRWPIRATVVCAAFVCTLAGTLVLRKWRALPDPQPSPQSLVTSP